MSNPTLIGTAELWLGDCMEYLRDMPDKHWQLALVDPPYGIGIVEAIKKSTVAGTSSMFSMTKGGEGSDFDSAIPHKEYFDELRRVSTNQIIWGGNYFLDFLGATRCMIVWDKMNGTNPMADAEIAWSSFDSRVRMFRMHHFSHGYDAKIHSCQKPVKLYEWLLTNYANPGDKILDTHMGSGSIAIATNKMGFELTACELDPDYFAAAVQRIRDSQRQQPMFAPEPHKPEQAVLI